jgi:C4-dicarboxylate-specific signal transduction histidine kinase
MALALAALTPGFFVVAFTEWQVNRLRQAEVSELALRSARQVAFELDRIISGVKTLILAVSFVPDLRDLDPRRCAAYLGDMRPHLSDVAILSVLDTTGHVRCRSEPSIVGDASLADRTYFQQALANPEFALGTYTIGKLSHRPILPLALAIHDHAGQPIGVVVASIDLRWLGEQLKQRGLPPGGSVTVADRNGVIIARQPLFDQFLGTKIPVGFMRLVNAPEPGVETVMS